MPLILDFFKIINFFINLDDSTKPSKGLKPAWQDEDDKHIQVKDVAATFSKAKGKHGQKDTSTENYAKSLRKKFTSFMDTPSWADLKGFKSKEEEDSDDEFFRVIFQINYGFLKKINIGQN